MKMFYVRKLMHTAIKSERLFEEATGWRCEDVDSKENLDRGRFFLKSSSRSDIPLRYSHDNHRPVHTLFYLLGALSEESLKTKFETVRDTKNGLDWFRSAPTLSNEDCLKIARLETWEKYQAALFSMGLILNETASSSLIDLIFKDFTSRRIWDIVNFPLFEELIYRYKALSKSGLFENSHEVYFYDDLDPGIALDWFKRKRFAIPRELPNIVNSLGDNVNSVTRATQVNTDFINPKEKASLLSLVHAMAKQRPYFYDPENARNGAIVRIENALIDAGLSLSQKTIRSKLREAEEFAKSKKEK